MTTNAQEREAELIEAECIAADISYNEYKNSGAKAAYEADLAHRIEKNIWPRYPAPVRSNS